MAARNVKVVVVGDGAVGKTCLLWAYSKDDQPVEYVPTVFDNYTVKLDVNGQTVSLNLWDTAGQEDLENIRCLSYSGTNCFLMCFSIDNPTSLANLSTQWLAELNKYCSNARLIVVGTKKDLRDDETTVQKLSQTGQHPVTFEEGKAKSEELNALHYFECSALWKDGVKQIFDAAMTVSLSKKYAKKRCSIV